MKKNEVKNQNTNRLVYQDEKKIQQYQQTANQLVESLNLALERFKTSHNHFSQPITEAFAFGLVTDPVGTFDGLLRANSPIKPIGNKLLDIEKLAELTGIGRAEFISDFTVILPGSVDDYHRHGVNGLLKLTDANKPLISWENGVFVLNASELEKHGERFRIYAQTKPQIELLEYWERLRDSMNEHLKRGILKEMDISQTARLLGLISAEKLYPGQQPARSYYFEVDYKKLGSEIQALAAN